MVCRKKVREKRDKRDKSLPILCRFLARQHRSLIFFVFVLFDPRPEGRRIMFPYLLISPLISKEGKGKPCRNVRTKRTKSAGSPRICPAEAAGPQFPKKIALKAL
jgi:hypothetical protein